MLLQLVRRRRTCGIAHYVAFPGALSRGTRNPLLPPATHRPPSCLTRPIASITSLKHSNARCVARLTDHHLVPLARSLASQRCRTVVQRRSTRFCYSDHVYRTFPCILVVTSPADLVSDNTSSALACPPTPSTHKCVAARAAVISMPHTTANVENA
ncbi:uncharacterized protein C8Q71DRAFT_566481 [Rhodofomes roseus]|uniref:Uncharacterized protein n=1 Tax=Rhodofomes roseus TaxID=34475 RepID=A0ABQ8KJA6_9APHY|nr:uncharacterized protein C8Q71DRAFT_566481 [Rhodofomes roseus]KAH9837882.1 hypothetical protein C8Q71DRAFT_566481 [Rhodofomes roseus]